MKPYFSVLMPMHNVEDTLAEAIESVLTSDFHDWELVIVDDGCNDDSLVIALKYAFDEPRIKVLSLEHRGLVASLNAGLTHCKADWVMRFDSDDLMDSRRMTLQKKLIESDPELVLVGGHVNLFPREKVGGGLRHYQEWLNSLSDKKELQRDIFVEAPIAHGAATFHKATVNKLGNYREGPWPEDYELYLRIWEAGHAFASVNQNVLHWRHHGNRLTFNDTRYSDEAFLQLKKKFLCRNQLKNEKEIALLGVGEEGKRWAKCLSSHGYQLAFWVDVDSKKIGHQVYGAPVISYEELALKCESSLPHLLVTVGINRARHEIRQFLLSNKLIEGKNFTCVA